jgi:hypothetical protein
MIPNIHIHEQLMFERHQERQREIAQHRQVKELLRQRPGIARRFVAGVDTLFLAVRMRLRRLEPNGKKVGYERSSVQ